MTKLLKRNDNKESQISNNEDDFRSKYFELVQKLSAMETSMLSCQTAFLEIEDTYNNSPCGFHTVDAKGVITRINDTELQWLGYSREQLVGKKKITDIISKEDRRLYLQNIALLKKGESLKHTYRLTRKDKSEMLVLIDSVGVFRDEGQLIITRATVFNMAIKKLMRENIHESRKELNNKNIALHKENEEMLVLNDAKDRFIGIAYHDLQSPLAVVMLLSKILLGNDLPDSQEKIRETYNTIYDASLQMNELIKNYLNVNRIEKGLVIPKLVPIDIIKLTKNIITRYEDISQRKKIPIFFTGSQKNILFTDAECYSQIIENLLSNAVKYTPRGKSVFIKIYNKGTDAVIEIEDEGVGIKASEIPLLYGKFQHLSSQPTDGELSTGLGLSIVKFLLDQLKGTIQVKSKLGSGTKFKLFFNKEGKARKKDKKNS
ncbi:MAG: PAS domain-containing sensor histidine kinase [Chitinophagaceae bacterium]